MNKNKLMQRKIGLIILFILANFLNTSGQVLSVGGPNEDKFELIETIGEKSLITIGTHNDSLVFRDTVLYSLNQDDPFTQSGKSEDVFIAKIDTTFQLQWIQQMGGLAFNTPNHLNTHKDRICFTVDYYQRLIFGKDTTKTPFKKSRGNTVFNMNQDGSLNWESHLYSPVDVSVSDITILQNNETLVLGNWEDTLSIGQQSYISAGFNSFLINYAPDGQKNWVKIIEGPVFSHDLAKGTNGFYIAGNVELGTLSLGNTPIVSSDTGDRLFIVKFNQQFQPVWTKTGYHGISTIFNLAYSQKTQSVYLSGTFDDYLRFENFQFEPGPDEKQRFNGFLFKLDSSGTEQFGKYANLDDGGTVAIENGKVLFTTNVENGERVLGFESKNSTFLEGWIGWLNSDGTIKQHDMTEGAIDPSITRVKDVTITHNQTLYATGSYSVETTFGDTTVTHVGSNDGFIWKIPNFTRNSSGFHQKSSSHNLPIEAYPNPTSGKLILQNQQAQQPQPVTLFNAQGQPVSQTTLSPGSNSWNLDLPAGLYFLKTSDKDGISGAMRIIIK